MLSNLNILREAFPNQDELHAEYFAEGVVRSMRGIDGNGEEANSGDWAYWYCGDTAKTNTQEEVIERMQRLYEFGWIHPGAIADAWAHLAKPENEEEAGE